MTTFDKREQAYENKYAHDEEQRFKERAKRNRQLGLWAAEKLGKSGAEAEAYAAEVMKADLKEAGEQDLVNKLVQDFAAAGQNYDDTTVRKEIDRLMVQPVDQVQAVRKI